MSPARISETIRLYAIGDIHGRTDLLAQLLEQITTDAAQHAAIEYRLIFLGDYIDRGINSKGVIDLLLQGLPPAMTKIFLRGNHEDTLLRFLRGDLAQAPFWLQFGGIATLASYGLNPYRAGLAQNLPTLHSELKEKIPAGHQDFLSATQFSYECGDYYFTHAGIRPGVALADQTEQDRMWIRQEFMTSTRDHSKIIVHGHTITDAPDLQPNRIGIDTGAYATGKLTCLVLQGETREFLST